MMLARAARESALEVAPALEECRRLLELHLADAVGRYGSRAIGVIDLPDLGTGRLVPAQIRACGVLYWTSEVENAGLLPLVEALTLASVQGTLMLPLGSSAEELARLWRTREDRFSESERRALFARVFGGAEEGGRGFPEAFRELVQGLVAIGRAPRDLGTTHLEARAAVAARRLGEILTDAGTGIAGFAARDIVEQIREALRLLGDTDLARSLGGGPPWQLVARHAPLLLGRAVYPQRHLSMASAGLAIIGWVASEAPAIEAGFARVGRAAPVVREAEAWSAAYGET
jgi:hypothetical protein